MGKSKKEKKKEIKKFSDWLEGRVFRVDPDRRNFGDHSGLRQYFMTQKYSPWISSFKQSDFEVLGREGQGEYFSEKPPKAHKQSQIKNAWRVLQNNFNVQIVEDLLATAKELKVNNVGFDSEGDIFV